MAGCGFGLDRCTPFSLCVVPRAPFLLSRLAVHMCRASCEGQNMYVRRRTVLDSSCYTVLWCGVCTLSYRATWEREEHHGQDPGKGNGIQCGGVDPTRTSVVARAAVPGQCGLHDGFVKSMISCCLLLCSCSCSLCCHPPLPSHHDFISAANKRPARTTPTMQTHQQPCTGIHIPTLGNAVLLWRRNP